tara:strand:- start:467 stop:793 length:327 start_codon:yes stop_codon:yes gene_type:complete
MARLAWISLLLLAFDSAVALAPMPSLARCELSSLRAAASPRAAVDAAAVDAEEVLPPTPAADDGMGELERPMDPTSMLTESEKLRRQPVHGLKRKRRSPKIVREDTDE